MSLVSYGDKQLCRARGGALHHIYPWLKYCPALGKKAAINTPADRTFVTAEGIFWRVVQDLCRSKLFPSSQFLHTHIMPYPQLCHLLCNIYPWELCHLGVLWWLRGVVRKQKDQRPSNRSLPWHCGIGVCITWRITDRWETLAGARLQSFQRLLALFWRENDGWNTLHRGFLLIHIKLPDKVSPNCWFFS